MMVYVDRCLLGSRLSIVAVAYYATPYEVVTKLLIVPGALVGVLFPAFSTAMVADPRHGAMLYRRATKYVGLFLFPCVFAFILFGHDFLLIWLGHEFALHSARVLQILSIGVFAKRSGIYSLCIGFKVLAARTSPGNCICSSCPFYLDGRAWILTKRFGTYSAAWAIRTIADVILLFWAAGRFVDKLARFRSLVAIATGLATVFAIAMMGRTSREGPFAAVVTTLLMITSWFALLGTDERTAIQDLKYRLLASRPASSQFRPEA